MDQNRTKLVFKSPFIPTEPNPLDFDLRRAQNRPSKDQNLGKNRFKVGIRIEGKIMIEFDM